MTYEEALKEAYKQPWKVGKGKWHFEYQILLDSPIPYGKKYELGSASIPILTCFPDLAEYIVNLHNKSLDLAADKVEYCQPKTIADLTDEQLFHIWGLAHNTTLEYKIIRRAKEYIVVGYEDMEDVTLYDDLNIEIHHDGDLEPACNQYQIYEYLRSLGIKPV